MRNSLAAIGAAGGLALGAAQMPAPPPLRLERKIDLPGVEGRIDHMSLDLAAMRLFMAALGNDTVEVVDLAGGMRARSLRGVTKPQGLLFAPAVNRLFVTSGGDGTVRSFDGASLAARETVRLGADADNVRLDADGRVWIGHGSGALAAIDAGGRKLADIPLGAHPESFQLEKGGARIFVNLPDARKVAVVDRRPGTVIASWSTGDAAANFPMALDEAHKRLFVVCRSPARVLVLDTDTGVIKASFPTVGDCDDVFHDAAAGRLYVSGGEGAIGVYRQVDADHYEPISRIETVKGARTSLFSPELGRLFLAVRRQGPVPAGVWVYTVTR